MLFSLIHQMDKAELKVIVTLPAGLNQGLLGAARGAGGGRTVLQWTVDGDGQLARLHVLHPCTKVICDNGLDNDRGLNHTDRSRLQTDLLRAKHSHPEQHQPTHRAEHHPDRNPSHLQPQAISQNQP